MLIHGFVSTLARINASSSLYRSAETTEYSLSAYVRLRRLAKQACNPTSDVPGTDMDSAGAHLMEVPMAATLNG